MNQKTEATWPSVHARNWPMVNNDADPRFTFPIDEPISFDTGDAECTACGVMFVSGTGHPTLAICGGCISGKER